MEVKSFVIDSPLDLIRIDKFLTNELDDYSRTQIQNLIKDNCVFVNDKNVKANYILTMGDEIIVNIPDPVDIDIKKEDIPLDIYYEDDDVIVINKPSGMVVHPALGNYTGTVVNALFTAFSNFIISIAGDSDSIMTLKFWTMGSLANATWDSIWLPFALVICACIFFLTQGRILNTMMIGDEAATTLGINLSIYRMVYLIIIAILTGGLVANCGVIGFVGLVIPHLSRAIVGSNHKRLIPIVIILGALFLIWADVLARVIIKNSELPIGIFTALVGAPFFIYIVARRKYGGD